MSAVQLEQANNCRRSSLFVTVLRKVPVRSLQRVHTRGRGGCFLYEIGETRGPVDLRAVVFARGMSATEKKTSHLNKPIRGESLSITAKGRSIVYHCTSLVVLLHTGLV